MNIFDNKRGMTWVIWVVIGVLVVGGIAIFSLGGDNSSGVYANNSSASSGSGSSGSGSESGSSGSSSNSALVSECKSLCGSLRTKLASNGIDLDQHFSSIVDADIPQVNSCEESCDVVSTYSENEFGTYVQALRNANNNIPTF